MNIQKNIELKKYTTFKIGGPAEYFVEVENVEELKEALFFAKDKNINIFILAGGTNILISEKGIKGLVVKIKLNKLDFKGKKVIVESGVILAQLLEESLDNNLIGLEFATGIPGTVGGAIRGNAGTYGLAMSDIIKKIIYLDENYYIKKMNVKECNFKYRHSIFKEKPYYILSAELKLKSGNVKESRKLIKERLDYRANTQPQGFSSGCVFKNVSFDNIDIKKLKNKGVDIEKFKKFKKIPSGYLIEEIGLKGKIIGGAKISEKHANYILNFNNATYEDVIILISYIKQKIRSKYGIQLEEEIQII